MGFKTRAGADGDAGYFALLRELRAARSRSQAHAAEIAAELCARPERLAVAAWSRVDDPSFVRALYAELARSDPALELALARLESAEPMALLGLRTAGVAPIAPLVASMLETGDRGVALALLGEALDQIDRPLPQLRAIAAGDSVWSRRALHLLAGSPRESDRGWALARAEGGELEDVVRARCAARGDSGHDDWLVERLCQAIVDRRRAGIEAIERGEPRHVSRGGPTELAPIIRAAGVRRLPSAIEPLGELCWSFDGLEALEALGAIGDPAAAPAIEGYLAALGGDPRAVAPFAIVAENALAALGDRRPVDRARAILDERVPRRFGYLEDELYRVDAAALAALVDRGDRADRERAAGFLDVPVGLLRAEAIAAYRALGRPLPRLVVYDEARISRAGEAALVAALDEPGSIGKEGIIEALIERGSPAARRRAVAIGRRRLESRVNTWIDEPYDAMPDSGQLLAALEGLAGEDRSLLEGTTSEWIRAFVLDHAEMSYPIEATAIAAGARVEVERFDRLPFVFGAHVNGLALSPDGRRLAVLGDRFGKVLDAETGAFVAQLDPGWSWGYDCAFTETGVLVACFHGGHVETYDPETGERIRDLVGHGGVPDGVKRLAVSPDGALAVSVGQDRQVIAWELASGSIRWRHRGAAGSCEAVAFSPAGDRLIASHVAPDYLTIHDPASGDVERIDTPAPVWAIAFSPDGRWVALGGDGGRVRLCAAGDLAVRRELELAGTTRLAFTGDGRYLIGCSTGGAVVRWAIEGGDRTGEVLLEAGAPLWALVVTPSGQIWTAGSAGVLHRIGAAPIRGEAHDDQITGVELLGGALITGGWDGRVLEWPADGGAGRERLAIAGRVNRLAAAGDRILAATTSGLYAIGESAVERLDGSEHDEIAVSGDRLARGAGRALEIVRLPGLAIEARVVAGSDDVSAVCGWGEGFLAGSEEGEVCYVAGGERRWLVIDHGHDRLDHGTSHKDVCDVVDTGDGFASSGNDNTVRIYRTCGGEPVRLRRLHAGTGIFNKLALSPDRRLLAIPTSRQLVLIRLADGETIAALMCHERFENEELTVARFVGDRELIAGTENGRLFRVRIELP